MVFDRLYAPHDSDPKIGHDPKQPATGFRLLTLEQARHHHHVS
jgi:hypothetical protein